MPAFLLVLVPPDRSEALEVSLSHQSRLSHLPHESRVCRGLHLSRVSIPSFLVTRGFAWAPVRSDWRRCYDGVSGCWMLTCPIHLWAIPYIGTHLRFHFFSVRHLPCILFLHGWACHRCSKNWVISHVWRKPISGCYLQIWSFFLW